MCMCIHINQTRIVFIKGNTRKCVSFIVECMHFISWMIHQWKCQLVNPNVGDDG